MNRFLEKAWNLNIDDKKWVGCLADRHVGCVSQPVRNAWNVLFNKDHKQVPRTWGLEQDIVRNGRITVKNAQAMCTIMLSCWRLENVE